MTRPPKRITEEMNGYGMQTPERPVEQPTAPFQYENNLYRRSTPQIQTHLKQYPGQSVKPLSNKRN